MPEPIAASYPLLCRGKLANPYPVYHWLRANDPVHWSDGFNGWLLTRYADVLAGLRDPRLPSGGRLASYMDQLPEPVRGEVQPVRDHYATWLVNLDPPDHTRLRGLVSQAFTPRMIENLRPFIQQTADELIEAALPRGRMELVAEFAQALPARVISQMLGVPPGDSGEFERWSQTISAFLGTGRPQADKARAAQRDMLAMSRFVQTLAEQRRQQPAHDLISALIAIEEQGDKLSTNELVGMCVFLLVAGHETTMSLISTGLLALLQYPGQARALRDNPSLSATAVEEFLRFESPLQHQVRTAREDIEIDGRRIRQGQRVLLMLGAANRDPAQFCDPDRLDIGRAENRHVAFGHGIHFCLGAPLARLEGQVAIPTLLRRLPRLALVGGPLEWREHTSMRSPQQLWVEF